MTRKSWSPRSPFISVLVRDPFRTHARNPFRAPVSGPPSHAARGTLPAERSDVPPATSLSDPNTRCALNEDAHRPARAGSTPAGAGLSLREALTLSVLLERMRAGETVHG